MAKMQILVTGGGGFLGREVVKQLANLKYRVRVTDLLKPPKDFSGDEYINGDLADPNIVNKSFKGIDYCIHLAAKTGGIGYYHKCPGTIIDGNNKLYSSVFGEAVKHNLKRIIYTSSSMIFQSESPYAFSKLTGEYYCRSYQEEFGLPYTIVRLFNLYGPLPQDGITFSHVIPDLIKKVLGGQYPVEILGSGKQMRCFTHVEDAARGIILALKSPKAKNEDFDLWSGDEMKILNLARLIFENCYPQKKFKYVLKEGYKMDVNKQAPGSNKARKLLGWKPLKKLATELPFIISDIRKQTLK